MIAYFDTSAVVKLVVTEPGDDQVERIWSGTDTALSSWLAYVELRAALAAALRAHRLETGAASSGFDAVVDALSLVRPDERLFRRAADVCDQHAVRGYDAVHLATAEAATCDLLVTADARMLTAGSEMGLATLDVSA